MFALLITFFPRAFRERFGDDMRDLFRDQVRAARTHGGVLGIGHLWLRTIPSLLHAVALERRDAARDHARNAARTRLALGESASDTTRSDSVLQALMSDLRFAGRMLRKSPVFAIVAVVAISLGTGAVTTIFSAMNAVVLRPLVGTTDGARLFLFDRRTPDFREGTSGSYAFYRHLRDQSHTLDGLAAWSKVDLTIATGGEGIAVYGNIVSGNFFSVLGTRPALGRFFTPDEDRTPLASPVIVVSHSFWETHLGGDSSVVGRPITVNGHPFTVIGVAPPGFRGIFTPLKTEAWVPLMMQAQVKPNRDLTGASQWLWMFGRLAPGETRETARRELAALTSTWAGEATEPSWARRYTSMRATALTGLPDDARNAFIGFTALLLGAAGLVLLIASVNVASMLSARAVARRREMALRTALGAARSRLVRQLLTESLLLFVIGALGGMVVAWIATGALEQIPIPGGGEPLSLELSPDPRVLLFALGVSLVTGIVFGLAPALQGASKDITSRLRNDTAASSARRSFASNALIVGQLALSLVLLVAAGLFIRALDRGARIDPGLDPSGVAVATFNTQSWGYDATKGRAFYRTLRERVAALPGVTAVSYTGVLPLTLSSDRQSIDPNGVSGTAEDRSSRVEVSFQYVDAGYFDVVRIPILVGRAFAARDDEQAPKIAVINETLARRLWPGGSALGRTFGRGKDLITVVGVARDSKYESLSERTPGYVYFPTAQSWQSEQEQTLLVRTTADPLSLAPALREAVHAIDAAAPRPVVRTLKQEIGIVLFPQRVAAMVTGALGAVGLLLAAIGLYGVIAYSVGRRTREIGVRVALGAQRGDVLGMVVSEGMRLAVTGVAIGVVLAAAATRLIAAFLFNVSPMDAVTFTAMAALFIVVALVASYLPARRAAATDPLTAIRSD